MPTANVSWFVMLLARLAMIPMPTPAILVMTDIILTELTHAPNVIPLAKLALAQAPALA